MNKAVIGLQWGDEGKGKIVDYLSENFDLVTRYQGGNNAGHTVIVEKTRFNPKVNRSSKPNWKRAKIINNISS